MVGGSKTTPFASLLRAGEDVATAAPWCFQRYQWLQLVGIDQCPELLVMMEHVTVSVPEGTAAASSMLDDFWGVTPGCMNSKSHLPAGNSASSPMSFGYISFPVKLARVGVCCHPACAGAGSSWLRRTHCSPLYLPPPSGTSCQ